MNIDLAFLVQLSRLFIPVVAFVGIFIAWHQYRASREKIRFELFEKRFNIYNSIKHTLHDILWTDELSREKFNSFMATYDEAQFLLPDKVFKDVEKISQLVCQWNKYSNTRNRRHENRNRYSEELILLEEQLEELAFNLAKSFGAVLNFKEM